MPYSKKKKADCDGVAPEGDIMHQVSDLVRPKYLSFLGCDVIL
jgi:hypothetical protein